MAALSRWPRLGLGCAALGTPPPGLSDADAEAVMSAAIEAGIRFFDVAPLYGGGLAECRLGRALARLPRDEYVLCTKAGVTRPFGEPPIPPGGTRRRAHDVWDYSAAAIRRSVATSLERLRVDRLDVVHLHDVEHRVEASLEGQRTLAALRDERVVGGIGIGSNFEAPVRALIERARFDAFLLAGRYTLLDASGGALFDDAHARGIRVVAAGVFNSGVLARWPQPAPSYGYQPAPADVIERTARIASICARHDTPIAAAALQFVIAHPAVDTVLLGPRSIDELQANLAAARHPIPAALWDALEHERLIPRGSPRPSSATAPALPIS